MDSQLTPEERLEVWGSFSPQDVAAEIQDRWGETDAYATSMSRTKRYTVDDWRRITAEAADINGDFITLLLAGAAPDSAAARDVAERHRVHISQWFYPCSLDIHASLGAMYLADPRFLATYENQSSGMASFVAGAIEANAISRT